MFPSGLDPDQHGNIALFVYSVIEIAQEAKAKAPKKNGGRRDCAVHDAPGGKRNADEVCR